MNESGDKLAAAYSALPREEPRASVDAAILAASRRAVAARPASRRWAVPVSIAAVLVLAFGVTLNMQQERKGIESADSYSGPPPAAPAPAQTPMDASSLAASPQSVPDPPPAARPAKKIPQAKLDAIAPRSEMEVRAKVQQAPVEATTAPAPAEKDKSFRDQAAPMPERKDARDATIQERALQKEANANRTATTAALARAPPAAMAPQAAPAPPAAERMKREFAPSPAAVGSIAADSQASMDEPTRELEAIAKLRREARHEEADKALAEFRRKRPDYRIPDAMWERVKPG
jgi:hypothetical protein